MPRVPTALLAALCVAAVLFLPAADRMRLASLGIQRVVSEGEVEIEAGQSLPPYLEEYVRAQGLDRSQPISIPLRRVLFATPAFTSSTVESSATLRFGGARIVAVEEPSDELDVHLAFREALLRGLRRAAAVEGIDLELVGAVQPARDGLNFFLAVSDERLELSWHMPQGPSWTEQIPWSPPSRTSLLPPLLAIAFALSWRRAVPALALGVLAGAFLLERAAGHGMLGSAWAACLDWFGEHLWRELRDPQQWTLVACAAAALLTFAFSSRNGGLHGLARLFARRARDARSTQLAALLTSAFIWFDDRASALFAGGALQPVADQRRISREKLAYLVNTAAVSVAGLAVVTICVASETSLFGAELPAAGLHARDAGAVFLQALPYRFYCIFSLLLAVVLALSRRDFGPMLAAERRARNGEQPDRPSGARIAMPALASGARAHRALVPLFVAFAVTLLETARAGGAFAMPAAELFTLAGASAVLRQGGGVRALCVGSLAGLCAATCFSLRAGLARTFAVDALRTLRALAGAIAVLFLAGMLREVCELTGTADYLTVSLPQSSYPMLLPLVLLLFSAAVSFATGSAVGTLGILLPLAVGLSYQLGQRIEIDGAEGGLSLMVFSIAAVLEGALFGRHASPSSDAAVLASIATNVEHAEHVRTQLPYAVLSLLVAAVAGMMPCAAFGASPLLALAIGCALLLIAVRLLGRRAEDSAAADRVFLGRLRRAA